MSKLILQLRLSRELFLGMSPKERLTATALLIDGVVFMLFPTIYENSQSKEKNPSSSVAVSRVDVP